MLPTRVVVVAPRAEEDDSAELSDVVVVVTFGLSREVVVVGGAEDDAELTAVVGCTATVVGALGAADEEAGTDAGTDDEEPTGLEMAVVVSKSVVAGASVVAMAVSIDETSYVMATVVPGSVALCCSVVVVPATGGLDAPMLPESAEVVVPVLTSVVLPTG